MVMSFHGFSFDLFGLSRREPTDKPHEISKLTRPSEQTVRPASQQENDVSEVSFRGLCIFPIL